MKNHLRKKRELNLKTLKGLKNFNALEIGCKFINYYGSR